MIGCTLDHLHLACLACPIQSSISRPISDFTAQNLTHFDIGDEYCYTNAEETNEAEERRHFRYIKLSFLFFKYIVLNSHWSSDPRQAASRKLFM
jgi:hypothetical protein